MNHADFVALVYQMRQAQRTLQRKCLPDHASVLRELIRLEREVDVYLSEHHKPRPADAFEGECWGAEGERSEG